MDRELYSIEQARALLGGIARNTIYELIRSGELASVPIGRRRFISAAAIEAFIATTTTTEPPEARSLATASRAVQMRLGLAPVIGGRVRREGSRR
jgi:excisionase family DNA binding protein